MSLSYTGPGIINAGPVAANAEVMEELNRARAPPQCDLQPAHLLRKQTTDSSLQDKVRFLAEAMGGECESWAEESERQVGLPRENSLDMIDLTSAIPDITEDQKIDPLMLDSSLFGWETPAPADGWRMGQQRSIGDGNLSDDKASVQESMHSQGRMLTLPIIEAQSKTGIASGTNPESIQNVFDGAFHSEQSRDLASSQSYGLENMTPMHIVPPKPLTVCNSPMASFPPKDEYNCEDIGPSVLQDCHNHSSTQMEHSSLSYDQYAISYQDYHHPHHFGSAPGSTIQGLTAERQTWGVGDASGLYCRTGSMGMSTPLQSSVLMPESTNPHGQLFGMPQARNYENDNEVLSNTFGSSGLSDSSSHMYGSPGIGGACSAGTGQASGLSMYHVDESIKQAVERCIKPMLGPDMQVGIVIIDKKSGEASSHQTAPRVVATSAESHSQVSSGQQAIHQNQNNASYYDGSFGTSFPGQTLRCPQSTLSDHSTNLNFGGLCDRLIDNTGSKPNVRQRYPSSKRMSSDLNQDLVQGPSFGQCNPDYGSSNQAIRGHSASSESVGNPLSQAGSRVPRSRGMTEDNSARAHQCPTKVSRRNTLGEGDPRQQSSGEENLCVGESGPSGGGVAVPQVNPASSHSENNQSAASNPSQGPSVEECLASLLKGMDTNQDLRQLLPLHAPGQVDAVLEAEMRTVDFDLRVARAERKIQEHNENMQRIDRMLASGQLGKEEGKLMRRRVYNRREAAASRARDDKRLREIVLQKRRLENLEKQLRELLVSNASSKASPSIDGNSSSRPAGLRNVLSVNDIEGLSAHNCED